MLQNNGMRLLLSIGIVLLSHTLNAQQYPLGYIKHFEAKFKSEQIEQDFSPSQRAEVKASNTQLHVHAISDSVISSFPEGSILLNNYIWGDFIANLSIMTKVSGTDSLSGIFFLTGIRDSSNYYFIQLNSYGANFYKMYKDNISLIDSDSSFIFKNMTWHDLRITRDILKRTITIELDKMRTEFYDPNLIMGYIGIGIKEAKFSMKRLNVWAPTVIEKPCTTFHSSVEKTAAKKLPD